MYCERADHRGGGRGTRQYAMGSSSGLCSLCVCGGTFDRLGDSDLPDIARSCRLPHSRELRTRHPNSSFGILRRRGRGFKSMEPPSGKSWRNSPTDGVCSLLVRAPVFKPLFSLVDMYLVAWASSGDQTGTASPHLSIVCLNEQFGHRAGAMLSLTKLIAMGLNRS